MSFILDALRKSEIERQRQSGPSMAEFPVAREDRRLPIALIAIGLLLAVNLAVVLFFMLRNEREAPRKPAPAGAARASAAAPAATAPSRHAGAADRAAVAARRRGCIEEPPAIYYEEQRHSRPTRRTRR